MPELTNQEWNEFLRAHPSTHLLQTGAWGALKAEFGWQVAWVVAEPSVGERVGAQILFKPLPMGFNVAYIPKGLVGADLIPGGEPWMALWHEIDSVCRRRKAVFCKLEPDVWQTQDDQLSEVPKEIPAGFYPSSQSIQPARTLLVDLSSDEEHILKRMKQKTRYNVRLARKKGIVVRDSDDIDAFYALMAITSQRDQFGVHSLAYYRRAYELFHPSGACELLFAEYEGQPLAGLMVFAAGARSWYLYGASSNEHRERMPTYLLQWEAMRWASAQGCSSYDLWGVPDADERTLEENFMQRRDGLWGVYRFKRGFGGELCRAQGPWDRVYRPMIYALYRLWAARRGTDD